MLRGLQLLLSDEPQQIDRLSESEITAVLRYDELFGDSRPPFLSDQSARLLETQLRVYEERRAFHHCSDRLLVIDLGVQRLREHRKELLAPHDAERSSVFHNGERQMFRILAEC